MTVLEVPISQGMYQFTDSVIGTQECTNLIPVVQQAKVLSQGQLIGTPGIRQITTSGDTVDEINRGFHVVSGIPYVIQGNTLYRLDRSFSTGSETFSLVAVGSPAISITGEGRLSTSDNGTQLMMLDPGGNGFIYNKDTDALQRILTGPFAVGSGFSPQHVVFIDGYFAVNTEEKVWFVSYLNDGTQWNILDFGSAESDPDSIVVPVVHNNQIFMLGSETTEAFQNIGGSGFPFQRSNIFLDKGCFAPFSVVSVGQKFYMIGGGVDEQPSIYAFSEGSYKRISNNAIDNILESFTDSELESSFSLSWSSNGQIFVSFTISDRTLSFNTETGVWFEQKSSIPDENGDYTQDRWRVNHIVTAYGYHIVGDRFDGRIGILEDDIYTEYDNNIFRVFTTMPLSNSGKSFRIAYAELTMQSGIGNGVVDPVVSMAISEDLRTFQYEKNRRIGMVGVYKQRTIWRKLGRVPRFAIMRFRITDPIKTIIFKLELDIV